MQPALPLFAVLLFAILVGTPAVVFGVRWLLVRTDGRRSGESRPTPPETNHPTRRIPGSR